MIIHLKKGQKQKVVYWPGEGAGSMALSVQVTNAGPGQIEFNEEGDADNFLKQGSSRLVVLVANDLTAKAVEADAYLELILT